MALRDLITKPAIVVDLLAEHKRSTHKASEKNETAAEDDYADSRVFYHEAACSFVDKYELFTDMFIEFELNRRPHNCTMTIKVAQVFR